MSEAKTDATEFRARFLDFNDDGSPLNKRDLEWAVYTFMSDIPCDEADYATVRGWLHDIAARYADENKGPHMASALRLVKRLDAKFAGGNR